MNFMERHQVVLYLISMGIGTVIASLGWIGWSEISEMFVPYVLGALLWTNFVLIPLIKLGGSGKSQLRKATMLAAALLTPAVTALLVPLFLPADGSVALAATIVLLAPCVDYVVVFTRIAGGEYRGLLAATPYLLILQFLTIPLWTSIYTYVGMFDTGLVESFFPLPAESYLSLVPLILPLIAAYTLQRWSHRSLQRQRTYERVSKVSDAAMIPTMCLLLVLMCIAYIPAVLREMHLIPRLAGLYTAYAYRYLDAQSSPTGSPLCIQRARTHLADFQRRHPQRPHYLPHCGPLRPATNAERAHGRRPHERHCAYPDTHRATHHDDYGGALPLGIQDPELALADKEATAPLGNGRLA